MSGACDGPAKTSGASPAHGSSRRAGAIGHHADRRAHDPRQVVGAVQPHVETRDGAGLLEVERLAGGDTGGRVHDQHTRHPIPHGEGLRHRAAELTRANDGHQCHEVGEVL
jgi:hypothetical protein